MCIRDSPIETARLIRVGDLHSIPHPDRPAVRVLLLGHHAQESGLSRPARTDDPDDRTGRDAGAEVLQENTIAVGFTYLFKLDDHISQTGARRDVDLPILAPLLILLALSLIHI